MANEQTLVTEDVATGLENPWALAFAPDGRLFVTEQPGRLRVVTAAGLQLEPVYSVSTIPGEAGLTGLALDPSFASNGLAYIHWCYSNSGTSGAVICRVDRIIIGPNNLASYDRTLLQYPVESTDHIGGRLKFGPDGLLYFTTGDHDVPSSAQDMNTWGGKVERMAQDGTPEGNIGFAIADGFRDPQGLAWDSSGALYGTDNGPTANDEVNLITSGGNYGWPICVGICHQANLTDPVWLFSTTVSYPPSGAVFYQGTTIPGWQDSLLIAILGLAGNSTARHVHRLKFDHPGGSVVVQEDVLWRDKFGRIRDVAEGPDGFLYFCTDNRNRSGIVPAGDDDRIVRARPK